jgi:hypothetical protein
MDAYVLVVQAPVEVFDVQRAHLGGAGAADVGGLEQSRSRFSATS